MASLGLTSGEQKDGEVDDDPEAEKTESESEKSVVKLTKKG